jgi:cytochrome c oxidase cbb3-type subunit 4
MDFDLNLLRAAVTLLSFLAFLGIVGWVMSRRRKAGFDEAARLPFLDDAPAAQATAPAAAPASLERRDE